MLYRTMDLNLTVTLSSRDGKIVKLFWDIAASSATVCVSDLKSRDLKQQKSPLSGDQQRQGVSLGYI